MKTPDTAFRCIDARHFTMGDGPELEYSAPAGHVRRMSVLGITMLHNRATGQQSYEFAVRAWGHHTQLPGSEFSTDVKVMIGGSGDDEPTVRTYGRMSAREMAYLADGIRENRGELCGLAVRHLSVYDGLRGWMRKRPG